MDPNTFFYMGTERMTTSSFALFRSFPRSLEGAKARPGPLKRGRREHTKTTQTQVITGGHS